jgi:hypothetical protein
LRGVYEITFELGTFFSEFAKPGGVADNAAGSDLSQLPDQFGGLTSGNREKCRIWRLRQVLNAFETGELPHGSSFWIDTPDCSTKSAIDALLDSGCRFVAAHECDVPGRKEALKVLFLSRRHAPSGRNSDRLIM